MKRTFAAVALVALAWLGSITPDEPAEACSIACMEGTLDLELVEVRLVELPQDAPRTDIPEWPESGSMSFWGSMWFDDGSYMYASEDGEVME